jgi:hypothetical protein
MIKIFVTYRCNLACPYCFATRMRREYPGDMTRETFARLLEWMRRAGLPAAAFIGGEPTLHPDLPEMIEATAAAGIPAALFTNGLFPVSVAERLAPLVSNFVVNYNDPAGYASAQADMLHATLTRLRQLGARVAFSKNFSRGGLDYGYLLDALDRYGVTTVRYDISRPNHDADNNHFTLDDTRQVMSHAACFVKACEARGVRTGLDCSVRLCDLHDEDRRYLERVSMKFSGICHPCADVHPDLSASYCLPMRGISVPDVTAFADHAALMWRLAEAARPVRLANVSAACFECRDFMRRCQGGCMALMRTACPESEEDETGGALNAAPAEAKSS